VLVPFKDSKLRIRNCTDEDYRFVHDLLKRNMHALFVKHWGGWDPKVFRDSFNNDNIKIVEYGTRRVAFYDLEFKEGHSYINNVQVSRSMRGKGLGTFLMDLIEKESKEHDVGKIRLKVFKDNPARGLYLELGYSQIKDEGPAVILEKKI